MKEIPEEQCWLSIRARKPFGFWQRCKDFPRWVGCDWRWMSVRGWDAVILHGYEVVDKSIMRHRGVDRTVASSPVATAMDIGPDI